MFQPDLWVWATLTERWDLPEDNCVIESGIFNTILTLTMTSTIQLTKPDTIHVRDPAPHRKAGAASGGCLHNHQKIRNIPSFNEVNYPHTPSRPTVLAFMHQGNRPATGTHTSQLYWPVAWCHLVCNVRIECERFPREHIQPARRFPVYCGRTTMPRHC